jgi:ABC-type spermidine/putrescine transport system permease subunit II
VVSGPSGADAGGVFNAIIPLMTVVNYSFQDTFGNNVSSSGSGIEWFEDMLHSDALCGTRWAAIDLHGHHPR